MVNDAPPAPQTWGASGKDVMNSVAHWMLVECVDDGHGWNTLTDSDSLVLRGHEMVNKIAALRGIPAGHVPATPGDMLLAMQDAAVESGLPSAPLPMWAPPADAQPEMMPSPDVNPPEEPASSNKGSPGKAPKGA